VPRIANQQQLLDFTADGHNQLFTIATLLLGANGGGLSLVLTVLKEYATTPQLRGVGVVFILFGLGLIASILFYASVFMIRATVRNALMSHEDPNDAPSKGFLVKLNVFSLLASVGSFIAAILIVIWKGATL